MKIFLTGILLSIAINFFHIIGILISNGYPDFQYSTFNLGKIHPLDELYIYGARISEILETNFLSSEAYIQEYEKISYYFAPFLGELFSSFFLFISGGDIILANCLLDFLLPILVFCLIYKIMLLLTENKNYSLFFAFLITLYFEIISVFFSNLNFASIQNLYPMTQHLLTRSVFSINLLIGLVSVFFSISYLKLESRKLFFMSIFFLGLCCYANSFIFIVLVIFNISLFILAHKTKFLNELITQKYSITFFVVMLFPYIYNQLSLGGIEYSDELLSRAGITNSFAISLLSLAYLFFLIALIFFKDYVLKRDFILLSSILIALIIAKNLQLILGFNVQIFHYDRDIGRWVLFIILGSISYSLFTNYLKDIRKRTVTILILVTILPALFNQTKFANQSINQYLVHNEYFELFEYLNNNTVKSSVIAANNELTKWIPAMTHNNTLMGISPVSFASNKELLERYYFSQRVVGYNDNDIKIKLTRETYIDLYHFKDMYSMASFPKDIINPDKALGEFKESFHELISSGKGSDYFVEKYNLDYILVKNPTTQSTNKFLDKSLLKVFENSRFSLYKLDQSI